MQIPFYLNHYVIHSGHSARTEILITLDIPSRKEFTTGHSMLTKVLEGLKEQKSEGTIKFISGTTYHHDRDQEARKLLLPPS